MTNDLEKEIELAEDLKGKLDRIEGKKPRKTKNKVSQEVKSPADADRQAVVGDMGDIKHKLETFEKPAEVVLKDIPDPIKHKYISFAKSGFRIVAGFAIAFAGYTEMIPLLQGAGYLLVIAEILGVAEEMV